MRPTTTNDVMKYQKSVHFWSVHWLHIYRSDESLWIMCTVYSHRLMFCFVYSRMLSKTKVNRIHLSIKMVFARKRLFWFEKFLQTQFFFFTYILYMFFFNQPKIKKGTEKHNRNGLYNNSICFILQFGVSHLDKFKLFVAISSMNIAFCRLTVKWKQIC